MISIITSLKNIGILSCAFLAIICFFTNAEIVNYTVITSINFCYYTLIPTLFPYMIISSLLLRSALINKALTGFFGKLFGILGICKTTTSPILIGNFCGFINGPKSICESYGDKLTKFALNKAIILSSNAGFSFVVLLVGKKLWGSFSYGFALYIFQIFISFLINLQINRHDNFKSYELKKQDPFISFTYAVTSSAKTMINICAFTIFTSVLVNIISSILNLSSTSLFSVLLSSLFDITQGVSASLNLNNIHMCAFFTGFSVGFGGLSVAFQTFSVCSKFQINNKKFIIMKFLQGIICGIFSLIYTSIFSISPTLATSSLSSIHKKPLIISYILVIFLVFIITSVDFFENIIYNNIIKRKGENHGRE